jgi:hypothetical protein
MSKRTDLPHLPRAVLEGLLLAGWGSIPRMVRQTTAPGLGLPRRTGAFSLPTRPPLPTRMSHAAHTPLDWAGTSAHIG